MRKLFIFLSLCLSLMAAAQPATDTAFKTLGIADGLRSNSVTSVLADSRGYLCDPGFGFAKTVGQNYELMRGLAGFADLGRRILVGVSRKSMIYKKFGITPEEALPATQALHMAALCAGADILRVHDVAPARQTIEIYRELYA